MYYLTYSDEFQKRVITCKESGDKVRDICRRFNISIYTLYKILHLNGKPPIPSEASEGYGSEERVEHRYLNPNNNSIQECPASVWRYNSNRHKKIKHACQMCGKEFYARDRGSRTKFHSKECRALYRSQQNSTIKRCDNCDKEFQIKNSAACKYVHCEKCRNLNLGRQSSKISRQMRKWLKKYFEVEEEKTFDWFLDKKKPKGRFRMDYYLPNHNLCVEFDGEQHFRPSFTNRWESVDIVQKRDKLKEKLCLDHGIKTIRFRYDEQITESYTLMKIYAELQGNEPVEV